MASNGGFGEHGAAGRLRGDQDANGGFFTGDDAYQVADGGDADMPRFDLDDDGFGFAGVIVKEVDDAVYALVGAFFAGLSARVDAAGRAGFDE